MQGCVWACGEVERACRVCGAEGGGRPWGWGAGERRWRVEGRGGQSGCAVVGTREGGVYGLEVGEDGIRMIKTEWELGEHAELVVRPVYVKGKGEGGGGERRGGGA